jgi:hypothetical protein
MPGRSNSPVWGGVNFALLLALLLSLYRKLRFAIAMMSYYDNEGLNLRITEYYGITELQNYAALHLFGCLALAAGGQSHLETIIERGAGSTHGGLCVN